MFSFRCRLGAIGGVPPSPGVLSRGRPAEGSAPLNVSSAAQDCPRGLGTGRLAAHDLSCCLWKGRSAPGRGERNDGDVGVIGRMATCDSGSFRRRALPHGDSWSLSHPRAARPRKGRGESVPETVRFRMLRVGGVLAPCPWTL